jgi:membrane protein
MRREPGEAVVIAQARRVWTAAYDLFADSGFSMAGAVAFSFVLALFPFCIFLGAFAGHFGNAALADAAVAHLFDVVPEAVAKVLEHEVKAVMGQSRLGLLTFGAAIALFFATSAVESLRAALNVAYRQKETKSYVACVAQSAVLVLLSALGMLVIAWGVVVGPTVLARFKPAGLQWLGDPGWMALIARYGIVLVVLSAQLLAYHLWLAAGKRTVTDVLPGIALSVGLWILTANLFSTWLRFNDYSRFYAGLTSIMVALVFFQVTAIIILLGAELNRARIEVRQWRETRDVTTTAQAHAHDRSV